MGRKESNQTKTKKFQNWGQCPTTFEKAGTFQKIVGDNNRKRLLAKKSYEKHNNT